MWSEGATAALLDEGEPLLSTDAAPLLQAMNPRASTALVTHLAQRMGRQAVGKIGAVLHLPF